MDNLISYKPYGAEAVLLEWKGGTAEERLFEIRLFSEKLEHLNLKEIVEFNFVYNSMLITYNTKITSFKNLISTLKEVNRLKIQLKDFKMNHFDIPVCYDINFGVDLNVVANKNNLSILEIINIHSSSTYTVFGIGFLPGFLYLGGLSEKLFCERKPTPRLKVPKGAVAIGGTQTGIYPQESPGGWQIIGKTPVSLFNAAEKPPSKFKPGDTIKFQPIDMNDFLQLEASLKHN